MTVELPAGIHHGTPEGYAAGCRREKDCPDLHTHGMACVFAHVRSQTDPRYYKAKVRDPRPAAIAARLGIRPPKPTFVEREASVDDAFAERGENYRWKKRTTTPEPTEALADATPSPEPAQPLAEHSQDTAPQEDAGDPAIEEEAPAAATPPAEVEEMGHPTTATTSEEPTVTTTAPEYASEFDLQCAAAIATPAGRKKVRDWARAEGFDVASQGRIPSLFVRSYVTATQQTLTNDPTEKPGAPEISAPAPDPVDDEVPLIGQNEIKENLGYARSNPRQEVDVEVSDPEPAPDIDALAAEFRPDWAGVTIPEDVRAARAIAARLEEDNARLTAELAQCGAALDGLQAAYTELEQANRDKTQQLSESEADHQALLARHELLEAEARELAATVAPRVDQIEQAMQNAAATPAATDDVTDTVIAAYIREIELTQRSLEFALRKYEQAKKEHQADNELHHRLIDKLTVLLRIEKARTHLIGQLLRSSQQQNTDQAQTIRQLRDTAPRPFWRRRR